ncbi:MAG: hypothetical protein AB7P02_22590 [Alphaproteobacteria bacterium]
MGDTHAGRSMAPAAGLGSSIWSLLPGGAAAHTVTIAVGNESPPMST